MKINLKEQTRITDISYYNHNYYLLDGCGYKGYTIMYLVHCDNWGLTSIQFGSIINHKFEAEYFCYGYEDGGYIMVEEEE